MFRLITQHEERSYPEKGKPFERVGRKATSLRLGKTLDMVVGLPGKRNPSTWVVR